MAMLMNLLDLQTPTQWESPASELSLSHLERKRGPGLAKGVREFRKPSKTQIIVWRCKRSQLPWLLPVINGWAGRSAPQELLKLRKPPGMNGN